MAGDAFRYLGFNFQLSLTDGFASRTIGGFSEVSGLSADLTIAEYRASSGPENSPRKVAGGHKATDVTLKRGVASSSDLSDWMEGVRAKGILGRKDSVELTLLDGRGTRVVSWTLRSVAPKRYTGPSHYWSSSSQRTKSKSRRVEDERVYRVPARTDSRPTKIRLTREERSRGNQGKSITDMSASKSTSPNCARMTAS
jgi:phage tail-like protein